MVKPTMRESGHRDSFYQSFVALLGLQRSQSTSEGPPEDDQVVSVETVALPGIATAVGPHSGQTEIGVLAIGTDRDWDDAHDKGAFWLVA